MTYGMQDYESPSSLAVHPTFAFGVLPAVSGGGGVSEVRVPEDGVLHDAAAFGR